jgi:beta-N-acetylhexosaminidase
MVSAKVADNKGVRIPDGKGEREIDLREKDARMIRMMTLAALLGILFMLSSCAALSSGQSAASAAAQNTAPGIRPGAAPSTAPDPTPTSDGANNGTGLTAAEKIDRILDGMTAEQKCGQLFLIRCPQSDAAGTIGRLQPGGIVLFAEHFKNETAEGIRGVIAGFQDVVSIPLLVAADEEGGTVNRISLYKQYRGVPFWAPRDLYLAGGFERIRSDTKEKAELLKKLGLNVNLAPVCDIPTDESDFIFARAFGRSAQLTSQYVQTVVEEMNRNGVGAVLKHFPGYGNNKDTHTGSSLDERSLSAFENSDFLPFEAGINAGAGGVLVSHIVVSCMDPDAPASLSPEVHRILRERLHFTGVVMTDDLLMEAVTGVIGRGEAAVQAVLAGNDMLATSDYESQFPAVYRAVEEGRISGERLDASVKRILAWKLALGLIS